MKKTVHMMFLTITLMACASCTSVKGPLKNLAKTQIDLVADIHIREIRKSLQEISLSLYGKNRDQLEKAPKFSLENRMSQILNHPTDIFYREVRYQQGVRAVELAFDPNYRGDRVFTLLLGISGMLRFSYNNLEELFILDTLDPQKLYDSARNLERIAKRLRDESAARKPLISLGSEDEMNAIENTLIRMVGIQDVMAEITEDRTQRMISTAIQQATTTLIPIGL